MLFSIGLVWTRGTALALGNWAQSPSLRAVAHAQIRAFWRWTAKPRDPADHGAIIAFFARPNTITLMVSRSAKLRLVDRPLDDLAACRYCRFFGPGREAAQIGRLKIFTKSLCEEPIFNSRLRGTFFQSGKTQSLCRRDRAHRICTIKPWVLACRKGVDRCHDCR